MFIVSVPISVPVSKKKRFYLNLNQYRNAHHHTLARAKVNFHDIVAPLVGHLPRFKTVDLVYTLFTGTEQLCDTSNICSIVDKFFSDVLVSCKKIEDDNRKIVLSVRFCWGGVDKFDPRVEVSITPGENSSGTPATDHNPEEPKMQISINQADIELAIEKLVRERVIVREDQEVAIDLRATRGPEGYQAFIQIVDAGTKASKSTKKASVSAAGTSASATKTKTSKASTKAAEPAATDTKAEAQAEVAEKEPAAAEPVVSEDAPVEAEVEIVAEAPVEVEVTEELTPAVASTTAEADTKVEATVQEDEPAPAPRQSLFGNLKKPENA